MGKIDWLAKLLNFSGGSEAVLKNKVNRLKNMKFTDIHV